MKGGVESWTMTLWQRPKAVLPSSWSPSWATAGKGTREEIVAGIQERCDANEVSQ